MKYPAIVTKKYLLTLSLPVFFSNLAVPLVGLVDIGLMGHLSNEKFLAATSIATAIISMIFWSFGFLRMGTVGLISQALGKGDYREIVLTTVRNLYIAAIIGFLIFFLKTPLMFLIQNFFQSSSETQLLIEKYVSIRLFSAPAELSLYVLVGLFLGLQKTTVSSFMIMFFSFLNIGLSYYFVVYLNLEIYGVALGTVISAYLTIFLFLIYAYFYIKQTFNIIPRFKSIFNRKKLLKLFNINFDIFIRTILLTFSFLYFTFQSSKLGEDYLAINSILLQFVAISSFILDAYAFSTEGVVGYSLGRKIKKSFLLTVSNTIQLSVITGFIISFIYLLFYKNIINSLTDLEYLRYLSYSFAVWVIIIPPVASYCYQYDGIFIGTSHTAEMRNSMIISVIIFLITSTFLTKEFGNHGLWFSLLIFMVFRYLTLKIFFKNILSKF